MTFEEFLWVKSFSPDKDDIVVKFSYMVTIGQHGLTWPVPMDSLEKLLRYIDALGFEEPGPYVFAARTAWNDYQLEKGLAG